MTPRRTLRTALAALVGFTTVLALAGPAAAHPGHEVEEPAGGAFHWFTHLDHLLVVAAVAVLIGVATFAVRRSTRQAQERLEP